MYINLREAIFLQCIERVKSNASQRTNVTSICMKWNISFRTCQYAQRWCNEMLLFGVATRFKLRCQFIVRFINYFLLILAAAVEYRPLVAYISDCKYYDVNIRILNKCACSIFQLRHVLRFVVLTSEWKWPCRNLFMGTQWNQLLCWFIKTMAVNPGV